MCMTIILAIIKDKITIKTRAGDLLYPAVAITELLPASMEMRGHPAMDGIAHVL